MLSFKQFEFKPSDSFEPSKETKEFWLYTKKVRSNFAGIELPGLFGVSGYAVSFSAFIAIFILEGLATYLGYTQGVNLLAVISSIIIDIILAIISHLWHDQILLYKNQILISSLPIEKENLKRKIASAKLKKNFFYLLIIISALFKVFMFSIAYYYGSDIQLDPIILGVSVCYIIAAILHIYYTGYFLFTSRFNFLINKEYDIHIASNGDRFTVTDYLSQPINTDNTNIELKETKDGKHSIYKEQNGKYYIRTYGILLDKELAAMIGVQQSPIAQTIIAREGLKHQLLILNTNLSSK